MFYQFKKNPTYRIFPKSVKIFFISAENFQEYKNGSHRAFLQVISDD